MPSYTVPNQRTIRINREEAKSDFLGIKNENWQSAARDLGAHSLMLYLYLASNKNDYRLALSPVAVFDAIGMPRSTFHDQFKKLVNKGYLVETSSNHFDFYELPRARTVIYENDLSSDRHDIDNCTASEKPIINAAKSIPQNDIQINNSITETNKNGINNDELIPKVEEITITIPKRQGKNETFSVPKGEFVF